MTEAWKYNKIDGAQKPDWLSEKFFFLDEKEKMLFKMLCISKNWDDLG